MHIIPLQQDWKYNNHKKVCQKTLVQMQHCKSMALLP